jgi:hypothetical protein
MFLHMACVLRDGRVQWHWDGIKREFGRPCAIDSKIEKASRVAPL